MLSGLGLGRMLKHMNSPANQRYHINERLVDQKTIFKVVPFITEPQTICNLSRYYIMYTINPTGTSR